MSTTVRRGIAAATLAAAATALGLPLAAPAGAATIEVTETGDSAVEVGTLRWAVAQASADATPPVIQIAPGLAIDLTCAGGGALAYTNPSGHPLVIEGNGTTVTQTCAGAAVLTTATEDLELSQLTLAGGQDGNVLAGGDVLVEDSTIEGATGGAGVEAYTGQATIVRSTLSGNAGSAGGGVGAIYVELVDSTLSGNSATTGGGAWADQWLRATNSTVTGNGATASGGGVYAGLNEIELTYVTLVGNSAPAGANLHLDFSAQVESFASLIGDPQGGGQDCEIDVGATISSLGANVTSDASCELDAGPDDLPGTDPMVAALGANGGPTQTRLPLAGSPALDRADCATVAVAADQRGVARPQGPACDSGAVEVVPAPDVPPTTPAPTSTTTPGRPAGAVVAQPRFTG